MAKKLHHYGEQDTINLWSQFDNERGTHTGKTQVYHGGDNTDILVVSGGTDDFVFRAGKGDDAFELIDIQRDWEVELTVRGSHTTVKVFDEDGDLITRGKLHGVEWDNIHIHYDNENPIFPW